MVHPLTERLILPGSPFELVPDPNSARRIFRYAPRSLQALFQNASRSGSRPCMAVDGSSVSFSQIAEAAAGLALVLVRRHGVQAATRVAVLAADSPAWLAAVVGVWWAGGVAVILDRHLSTGARWAILEASECATVITERDCSRALRDCGDRRDHILLRTGSGGTGSRLFYELEVEGAGERLSPPVMSDPDEDALIAFTSGSTGTPKGVVSTHRAVLSGMFNTLLSSALTSARDRTRSGRMPSPRGPPSSLLLSPFSHVGGYSHLILMAHVAGKVIPQSGSTIEVLATLAREDVTVLSGASAPVLTELLRSEATCHALRRLSAITLYGSAPARRLILELQSRFPAIQLAAGYGLTETNGSICSASGAELLERPGTCGPVLPSVELSIRDESGSEVPTGHLGEIWVRGPMLMRGYVPPLNGSGSEAGRDGWFCTDDCGWRDSDGYLYVSERRQDVLWTSAGRISCTRIEQLLCDGGMAEDAVAFGEEAPLGSGRLIIAIVPASAEACHERVAATVNRMVSPGDVQLTVLMLDRLPRTPSGKPDRLALRQLARANGLRREGMPS